MIKRCRWQWFAIVCTTLALMIGRLAAGEPGDESNAELQAFKEQMQAYGEPAGDPQHPTPRERSLEADLAVMHDRAVTAEAALATCQAEVTTLKEAP
jgi:hypothetical protein|tara:strand:- start:1112 stop:1402 length:291 start_codon:yes stop_codon:yes gene_type:complete